MRKYWSKFIGLDKFGVVFFITFIAPCVILLVRDLIINGSRL